MSTATPKMLELFCGSKQMTDVARHIGFQTVTLDNDPKVNPDILGDILTWDYKDKRYGHFDLVHASIPCEEFSVCHTRGERNLVLARQIANRTREIIEHFLHVNPKCLFTIENPSTSLLTKEEAVKGLTFADASYCSYGYPYRKNTRFWHNFPQLKLKTCSPENCFWKIKGHPTSVQDAPVTMRAHIPTCLCFKILMQACEHMGCLPRLSIALKPLKDTTVFRGDDEVSEMPRIIKTRRSDMQGACCSVCSTSTANAYRLTTTDTPMCTSCYKKHLRRRANNVTQASEVSADSETVVSVLH
jgi:hypothetical protein